MVLKSFFGLWLCKERKSPFLQEGPFHSWLSKKTFPSAKSLPYRAYSTFLNEIVNRVDNVICFSGLIMTNGSFPEADWSFRVASPYLHAHPYAGIKVTTRWCFHLSFQKYEGVRNFQFDASWRLFYIWIWTSNISRRRLHFRGLLDVWATIVSEEGAAWYVHTHHLFPWMYYSQLLKGQSNCRKCFCEFT